MKTLFVVGLAAMAIGCGGSDAPAPAARDTVALLVGARGADGAPGPAGARGEPGAPGAAGTPGRDATVSGARIKARWLVGDDGARAFVGWLDSKTGERCDWRWTAEADGARCVPVDDYSGVFGLYYLDAACASAVAVGPSDAPVPKTTTMLVDSAKAYFELGASVPMPASPYWRSGGACSLAPSAPPVGAAYVATPIGLDYYARAAFVSE